MKRIKLTFKPIADGEIVVDESSSMTVTLEGDAGWKQDGAHYRVWGGGRSFVIRSQDLIAMEVTE